MYAHKKMKTTKESALAVLKDVLPLLEAQEEYSNDALYQMLLNYVAEDSGVTVAVDACGCYGDYGNSWQRGDPASHQKGY